MSYRQLNKIPFLTILTFLITQLLLFEISYAQTVNGAVLDAQSKEVLPGATIMQANTTNGTSTNTQGEFKLTLQEGEQAILVSFVGYKTTKIDVSQAKEDLEILLLPDTFIGNEVFVEATRVDSGTPMSYTNVDKDDLEERNLGQDLPYLINTTPSVVSTSDAGAGVGYTGISIRGVDPTRINVTINGIPLNNSESHEVYWVNLPDLTSSVDNLQIQRGVGTSANGVGAFGASVNLQTSSNRVDPYAQINTGLGSFNTKKVNIQLGSGLMKNGWQFEGRLSKLTSDGFIDRADSDLDSYYISAAKRGKRSLLKADIFHGKQQTYQAWNGVEESILRGGNRTYNEQGTEKQGTPYENQVDNYQQNIYQLHYSYSLTDNWTLNTSLHYTKGLGYYEEYKVDQPLIDYDIYPIIANYTYSDIVRRRWLDNDFYGVVFNTKYTHSNRWNIIFGGGIDNYTGSHFGEVIWARNAGNGELGDRYYTNDASKLDYNLYGKLNYLFTDRLNAFLDLQVRGMHYEFEGLDIQQGNPVNVRSDDDLLFFNPKMGLVFRHNNHRLFASFAVANKEPTRDEYIKSTARNRPTFETLYNIETGYKVETQRFFAGVNGYSMMYKDQLILTGQINETGRVIRQNIPDSYRMGVELEAGVSITNSLSWAINTTLSRNKINRFTEYVDDYDNGGQIKREYHNTDIALSPNLIGNSIVSYTYAGFKSELISKYVGKQYLDNTQSDSRSIDAYFVNNILLSYKLNNFFSVKSITVSALINNIFNTEYETHGYTFGFIDGGEQRYNYYYPQAGTNFMFQVKWDF